ncbi:MAG: hypothetical protein ACI8RZ_004569 [Myxococcota bacterium]
MIRFIPPLIYAILALTVMREALVGGHLPGTWSGEAWGRAAVSVGILRWLSADVPIGQSDLLNWPDGLALWPIDPLLQLLAVPVEAILGGGAGVTAVMVMLLTLAGLGPYWLSRSLKASRLASGLVGLLIQLTPYLLRNLMDAVVEVGAIGLVAVAIIGIRAALQSGTPRSVLLAGLGIFLVAGSSPYYAVYLVIGCAAAVAGTPGLWRRWLMVAGAGALACAIALAPLWLAEGGDHGRFVEHAPSQGYQHAPSPLVAGTLPEVSQPPMIRPGGRPPAWRRAIQRAPAGGAILLAGLIGLILPGGRRWVALGLLFFLGGPGPDLIGRMVGIRGTPLDGPLLTLLNALPLTDSLGNPTRMLAPFALLSAVGFGLSMKKRWWLGIPVAALMITEALFTLPTLSIPATPTKAEPAVLAALEGPTVILPSGDFPIWSPVVAPKEAAFLSAQAGVPIAADYGRQRIPADLSVQLTLLRLAGAPYGVGATQLPAIRSAQFDSLLLLEDRFAADGLAAVRSWLVAQGAEEVARGERSSAWRVDLAVPL